MTLERIPDQDLDHAVAPPPEEFDKAPVMTSLAKASSMAGGAAKLFDRYVLFRLPAMLPGGRYPTPRHIVRFMVGLAADGGEDVADFACGSGGYLVHVPDARVSGVEISPEWASLARANCLLHRRDWHEHEILVGNALRLASKLPEFDIVLMNPPFGERVKSEHGIRTRSETALIAMALEHLAPGGSAALLAPGGLLFNSTQHESALRRRLVKDYTLEAVITLPKDAFQPYSSFETHLLLTKNTDSRDDSVTWFIRPAFDGYVSGRGRDLTEEPKEPNDLSFIVNAFPTLRAPQEEVDRNLSIVQWVEERAEFSGAIVRPIENAVLAATWHLPARQDEPAAILVEIDVQGQRRGWQYNLTAAREFAPVNIDEVIKNRTRKKDPPRLLFQNQSSSGAETLTAANAVVCGILLKCRAAESPAVAGVAVSRTVLQRFDFSLDPNRFLQEPEIRAEQRLPHDILRDIKHREQLLVAKMSQLAGRLVPEGGEGPLPSPVQDVMSFGSLDLTQQRIWEAMLSMRETVDDQEFAVPFTAREVLEVIGDKAIGGDAVLQAFELFEAMGVIVRITLQRSSKDQFAFYRRVEKRDTWRRNTEGAI